MRALLWVARHKSPIFLALCILFTTDVIFLWCGYSLLKSPMPLGRALESTCGFLFTLASPDAIGWDNVPLRAGHLLGWFVSLAGWLLFPLLVSLLLSQAENIKEQSLLARRDLEKLASELNLPAREAAAVSNAFTIGLHLLAGKKGRASPGSPVDLVSSETPVRRAELRVRCSSDLPRYPSAAKVRNLIRIQKGRNDIQEMAYRLALVETF
jgi:hypothetical protein